MSICGLVAACSDSTTPNSSSSSGTPSSSGNTEGSSGNPPGSSGNPPSSSGDTPSSSGDTPGDQCKIAPGTYTAHYTKDASSGAQCTEIKDQTLEIKDNADGGTTQPAPGCKITEDKANCKITTDCETKAAGYTTTSHSELTTKGGSVSGTTHTKTVKDADGSSLSDCSYGYTWTKK